MTDSRSVLDILGIESRVSLRPEASGPDLAPLAGARDAGKYQLQGEIARGGVGAVLKGFDTHLGRDVAVKLLHEDYLGNPDVLQRFVEEAQIGGQLQHPGIVPVYDLGLQGNRPFFSMKLVKGRTLASLLEERAGRSRLLAIFEQVCHTMAYAHTRSVIHRDLKPANIMVGAFGEVQVVDWGMGKVLGKGGIADETRAQLSVIATVRSEKVGSQSVVGSVMGTPAYMPPEQAQGDVERMDERSDVFSLGAVLCEILTGAPPYVGDDLIRQAANADQEKCSERLDACDADDELKQLVRQCLSPAPQARPKDANELADKIGKHLTSVEDRAQQAQVDAAGQQVKAAEARRAQKLTLGIAASVLLTLAVGGGGWWWLHADRARRHAKADRAVQAALDDARVAYGSEDWDAALADARRAAALARDASPAVSRDVAGFLTDVARQRQEATDRTERLEAEQEMLAVLEGIPIPPDDTAGQSVDPYGKPESARRDRAYREAFAEFGLPIEDLTVEDAARRIRAMTQPELWAAALDDWAWATLMLHGPQDKLRPHLLGIAKLADRDDQRAELREMRKRGKVTLDDLRRFDASTFAPATARLFAEMYWMNGDVESAGAVLRETQRRHPDSFPIVLRLAQLCFARSNAEEALRFASVASALRPRSTSAAFLKGNILRWMVRYPEAESALRRAIRNGPTHAVSWHQLGHVLDGLRRPDEALAAYRKAVDVDADDADAHTCLGSALRARGNLEEAERLQRRAIDLDPRMAMAYNNLGGTLNATLRFDEAEAAYRKAIELDPRLALAHSNLGHVLMAKNLPKDALQSYDTALALEPNMAMAHTGRADALRDLGELEESERAARKAIELDPELGGAYFELGNTLVDLERPEEAVAAYRDAIAREPGRAIWHNNLGVALDRAGQVEKALASYREAYRLDPRDEYAALNIAATLVRLGHHEEALPFCEEAVRLDESHARRWELLGHCLVNMQRWPEAIAPLERALELDASIASALNNLAVAYSKTGQLDDALRKIEEACRRHPEDALIWANRGNIHWDRRELDQAVQAFDEAIRLEPDYVYAHAARGEVYCAQGKPDKAIESYRAAYRLDPDYPGLRRTLAGRLYDRGRAIGRSDPDAASAWYREALEVDPNCAEAWCNLGGVLRRQGKYAESLRHYEKGHELGSKRPEWKYDSAKWVETARALVEMEPRLERVLALEVAPRDGGEAYDAAILGKRRKEYAQVLALARSVEPQGWLLVTGARVAALAGEHDLARKWLKRKLASDATADTLTFWLEAEDFRSVRDGEIPPAWSAFWRTVREDPQRTARVLALEEQPRDAGEASRAVALGLDQKKHAETVACVRAIAARFPAVRYNGACAAALGGDLELAVQWLRADLAAKPAKEELEWWLKDPDLDNLRTEEYEPFWRQVRAAIEERGG
jgi:serine/threonine-protein kinase